MTYRILTVIVILLVGCKGEIEFKKVESESRNKPPNYREMFLVANSPNNQDKRDSLLIAFAKKHNA